MTARRNSNGQGALFQRGGKGPWYGVVTTGYTARVRGQNPGADLPSQARKWVCVSGKTKAEAERKLQAVRHNVTTGQPQLDGRTTLAAYLPGWLERKQNLRPATRLRYAGLIREQLVPNLGRVPLAKLTPEAVEGMLVQLQKDGLSPRTASHCRAVLRTSLNAAPKSGQVARNAAALADPPSVPKPKPKTLPVDDINRVLDAVSGTDIENVVTLALFCGARQVEILGLRWEDVSFEYQQLTVRHSLQKLGRQPARMGEPKSETSKRTLQLPGPAVAAVRAEKQRQAERQLAAGPHWKPPIPGLAFTDAVGAPLTGTNLTRAFQRKLREAGLPPLRFHDLRKLHGALLLLDGVDIATVRDVFGHSSIALTASVYAGIMPALKRDAAERFERALSRRG